MDKSTASTLSVDEELHVYQNDEVTEGIADDDGRDLELYSNLNERMTRCEKMS